jgi:hypothetical protein
MALMASSTPTVCEAHMTEHQQALFPTPGTHAPEPPAARDRPTSVDAAKRVRQRAPGYRDRVLAAITAGPKTDEEIERFTNLRGNTVRPRRLELLRAQKIRDSGRTRITASGREAVIWEVVP